jgi:signal peptidase I
MRKFSRELVQTIVIMAVLFFGTRAVMQNFRVEGPSMQPTLHTGEFLWVNKAAYFSLDGKYPLGGPQRGDVAVLHAPDAPDDLIKRVIGLPGDTLSIYQGQVFVNGKLLSEPYITLHASYTFPPDGGQVVVPENEYFVLGDNRANSRDSHMGWFVPAENLVGRAWLSYWPPAAWGVMPGVAYATDSGR